MQWALAYDTAHAACMRAVITGVMIGAPMQARVTVHFEGWAFALGDFAVRVGKATLRPQEQFRGIMVEVEYAPVPDLAVAAPALTVSIV